MLLKYVKTFLFFCILVILIQGCKKSCEENARNYTFENKVILEARRLDTLKIGDTVTMKLKIPYKVKNNTDSSLVDISSSNPSEFTIGFSVVNNINGVLSSSGLSSFGVIRKIGNFSQIGSGAIRCTLERNQNYFVYEMDLILNHSGLMLIQPLRIFGDLKKTCSVYTINNTFNNYNHNHNFYYNLTGSNSSSVLLTERDLFIWVK